MFQISILRDWTIFVHFKMSDWCNQARGHNKRLEGHTSEYTGTNCHMILSFSEHVLKSTIARCPMYYYNNTIIYIYIRGGQFTHVCATAAVLWPWGRRQTSKIGSISDCSICFLNCNLNYRHHEGSYCAEYYWYLRFALSRQMPCHISQINLTSSDMCRAAEDKKAMLI